MDNQENRATGQTLEYVCLHASLKDLFVNVQWEVDTERTELFKKIGRFKEHCKLAGFPNPSVQGVIAHVRLSEGMAMEERTSVKVRESVLANQRQYRAKLNV